MSGPPLGRPNEGSEGVLQQQLAHQDEIDRIAIEGKFGQGKHRFSLARIMAKLAVTAEAVVRVSFR
jgi:IS5 family transposase